MKIIGHMINWLAHAKFGFNSQLEKLWERKTNGDHFKVFGFVCYLFVPDQLRMKSDKKVIMYIFVGCNCRRK